MAETTRTTPASPSSSTSTPAAPGAQSTAAPGTSPSQAQRQQVQPGQAQRPSTQTSQAQTSQAQQAQANRDSEYGRDGKREQAVEKTADPMTEARKVGSELVGAARDSALSLLDAQRNRAADQIAAIGEAVRRSAESLDETGGGALVRYADQTANQIRGFADTIRDRSWTELADDIESFARRWPMVYMASAVGIGFIAGRFMLSSAERSGAAHRSGTAATSSHSPGHHSPGGTTGPIRGGNPAISSGTSGATRIGPGTPADRE